MTTRKAFVAPVLIEESGLAKLTLGDNGPPTVIGSGNQNGLG